MQQLRLEQKVNLTGMRPSTSVWTEPHPHGAANGNRLNRCDFTFVRGSSSQKEHCVSMEAQLPPPGEHASQHIVASALTSTAGASDRSA